MLILVPVVFKKTEPVPRDTALVTPIVLALVIVRTGGVLAKVKVAAPSVTVMRVLTVPKVTATLPSVRFSPEAPVAVTVLAVDVPPIVPVPVEVMETLVPLSTPAKDMEEFVPLFVSVIAPLDVSPAAPTVIPVPEDAESVNVTDDGLLVTLVIEVLAESVMNTEPAVLSEIVGALVSMLLPTVPTVPVPVPVTRERVPVADMLVAPA